MIFGSIPHSPVPWPERVSRRSKGAARLSRDRFRSSAFQNRKGPRAQYPGFLLGRCSRLLVGKSGESICFSPWRKRLLRGCARASCCVADVGRQCLAQRSVSRPWVWGM
jgi:hypothetical protein